MAFKHLSSHALRLASWCRINQCQVSVPGVDSLFYTGVYCKLLASHVLLHGPKGMYIYGPHTAIWICAGYSTMAGRLWSTLPTVQISRPVIFISWDPLRSTWLASSLQQTTSCSKLQALRHHFFNNGIQTLIPERDMFERQW